MSRALRALGCGATLAWLLSGCSGSSATAPRVPAAPDAAGDVASDKVLNLYNWADFIDPAVLRAFEAEFGIKVTLDVYDSNEVLETKLLTGRSNYDVVVPSGYFFERQIKIGVYQKLDTALLPNLRNLDPEVTRGTAVYDPGNQYGVDYTWLSTTGIGYDVEKINARLAHAPVDSWRMVFDPLIASHFKDCGIAVLDSPVNVVSAALAFLGKDPNSESPEDLAATEALLLSVRPYIRYVDSVKLSQDLANGEICLSLGWSGDVTWARDIAREARTGATIAFSIPVEGTVSNFDLLAIPADAPHPRNAHVFINFLLRADVAARNTNRTRYANGVTASMPMVTAALRDDPGVYPPAEVRRRLVPSRAKSQAFTRLLMRSWTRFKTGRRL